MSENQLPPTFLFSPITLDQMELLIKKAVQLVYHSHDHIKERQDEVLTIKEASQLIKIKVNTIYDLVSQDKIPHMKPGRNLLFMRDELLEWLKTYKRKTKAEVAIEVDQHFLKS